MEVTPRAAAKATGKPFATSAQLADVEAATQAAIDAAAVAGTAAVAETVAGTNVGGDAAAAHLAAANTAEAALSLREGGMPEYRASIQAGMWTLPPGSTIWWSKLRGGPGQRWRVRSDCMMAILFINDRPHKRAVKLDHLTRGDCCIQVEQARMFVHQHCEGKTAILKMRIEPAGWIAVAMRGAENYGFLEMDGDVEREDRTDEGHGLQWPGQSLAFVGRPDTDLVNAPCVTCFSASHAPAGPLVPSSAFASSVGAQSPCLLLGHIHVCKQWSATDGDCCVCKKPLPSDGTGCANCPVKCCEICMPPHPCRLGSLKRKLCFSCQQPVISGLETLAGRTLFCATCQPFGTAGGKLESVAAADVGMEDEPAGSVTAKGKADCAFGETLPRKPFAEALAAAVRQRAAPRPVANQVPALRLTGPRVLPPSSSVFPAEPPAAALPTMQPPVLPSTLPQATSACSCHAQTVSAM